MTSVLWTILLMSVPTMAQVVCTNRATLLNAAYAECVLDSICMDSFYLSSSAEVWERPRFDYLLLKVVNTVGANTTLLCSDELIFLEWFSVVKHWNFCKRNEVYSLVDGGCVCNSGRNCDLKMNGDSGYSTKDISFLLVLMLIGGAYFYTTSLRKLDQLKEAIVPGTKTTLPSNKPTATDSPSSVFT